MLEAFAAMYVWGVIIAWSYMTTCKMERYRNWETARMLEIALYALLSWIGIAWFVALTQSVDENDK